MQNNSEIAANRTIVAGKDNNGNKIRKNVRYRNKPIFEIYNTFDCANELSLSTFRSYIGSEFKSPHLPSDICDYCEFGKNLKKEIINMSINEDGYKYNGELDFDSKHMLTYYQENLNENSLQIIKKINDLQEIEYHQLIANRQRKIYNEQRSNEKLLRENVLIELDFKEKIIVGLEPRQVNLLNLKKNRG